MCVSDKAIVGAAVFKIFPDILSRPVAFELDKPFRSLTTLVCETNLKRVIFDVAGLTKLSNVMSVSSIELAKLGPMSVKYVLKALAISSGEVIFVSLNFN
jgi:hypothetical protein